MGSWRLAISLRSTWPIGSAFERRPEAVERFVARHANLVGRLALPGLDRSLEVTRAEVIDAAKKFFAAIGEAGRIFRRIEEAKGRAKPVIEVSMDETDRPQTPLELFVILAAVAEEGIPAQTIAPRFVGRFNKGVDYVGDVAEFGRQFEEDLAVVAMAIERFPTTEEPEAERAFGQRQVRHLPADA